MLRRQTRIAHGHGQAGVTLDFLQGEDVAAVLNEVAGEGVSQGVGGLAFRQVDAAQQAGGFNLVMDNKTSDCCFASIMRSGYLFCKMHVLQYLFHLTH